VADLYDKVTWIIAATKKRGAIFQDVRRQRLG